jgi:hypothetical protein
MAVKRQRTKQQVIEDFGNQAEKEPAARPAPIKSLTVIPAWKRRNREPKHVQIMLRASESQRELLQAASEHQEVSQQKILEALVWPVLEEQYGITETEAPA